MLNYREILILGQGLMGHQPLKIELLQGNIFIKKRESKKYASKLDFSMLSHKISYLYFEVNYI